MRMSEKRGSFLITVFTAPEPFRGGPVDIHVLVPDALTRGPVPQTRVTGPPTKPGQLALGYPAPPETATTQPPHAAHVRTAEPVVGIVLLEGLVLTLPWPARAPALRRVHRAFRCEGLLSSLF